MRLPPDNPLTIEAAIRRKATNGVTFPTVLGISGLDASVSFKRAAVPHLTAREHRIVQGLDSAAALVTAHGVQAAAAEERFTGDKATGAFPQNAIRYCLRAASLTPADVDYVAHGFCYEAPPHSAPRLALRQFHEVYRREVQLRKLAEHDARLGDPARFVPVRHHIAHAASAFYPSGFDAALILVADGMGERESMTIALGGGNSIEILRQVPAMHSLGILYGVVTMHLGFWMGLDEYKVMGLAPHGDPSKYFDTFMSFVQLHDDGEYTVPLLAEDKTEEERETHRGVLRRLTETLGPSRRPSAAITTRDTDVAAALQAALQTALLHVLRYFRAQTGQRNLCMAGGVALNCTANGVIRRSRMFDRLFVQPAAGDDGTALGAALAVQRRDAPRSRPVARMSLPLWGPRYSDADVDRVLAGRGDCHVARFTHTGDLVSDVSERLARGEVVAWFQGRMEFGPRALGNRSLLASPFDEQMREHINRIVKRREAFRPFAPAVTLEAATRYFEVEPGEEATFDSMVVATRTRRRYRETFGAVTHVDGSARLQIVRRVDNERFWDLLVAFEALTGHPVLLNTSFNLRGQPIVCDPRTAVETFAASEIDALAIEDRLLVHATPPSGAAPAEDVRQDRQRIGPGAGAST